MYKNMSSCVLSESLRLHIAMSNQLVINNTIIKVCVNQCSKMSVLWWFFESVLNDDLVFMQTCAFEKGPGHSGELQSE